jgi:hypothetical protein
MIQNCHPSGAGSERIALMKCYLSTNYGISTLFSSMGLIGNEDGNCVMERCWWQAAVVRDWLNGSHFPESFNCFCYPSGRLSVAIKEFEYAHDPGTGNGENGLASSSLPSRRTATVLRGLEMPQEDSTKSRYAAAGVSAFKLRRSTDCSSCLW